MNLQIVLCKMGMKFFVDLVEPEMDILKGM